LESTKETKILCDAAPFGFGPASILKAILKPLKKSLPTAEITVLATGTTLDFFSFERSFKVLECNSTDKAELLKVKNLFAEADVFIDSEHLTSCEMAAHYGTPTVFIDPLFWMWNSIPKYTRDADVYIIQNFPSTSHNLSKMKPNNPILVGPIVDNSVTVSKKLNQITISFGGLESWLIRTGIDSDYPFIVADILVKAIHELSSESRFLVTGNPACMAKLREAYRSHVGIEFACLSHKHFMEELAKSRLFLTSPGLGATYEAFSLSIPVVFLPPQNHSQFQQLKLLRSAGVAPCSFHWLDVYPETDLPFGCEEEEGVKRILQIIHRFSQDEKAQDQLKRTLVRMMTTDLGDIVSSQQGFLKEMGSNGVEDVVESIVNLL
jgi:hypothetical protein